jgi:isochorismate synthase EntC
MNSNVLPDQFALFSLPGAASSNGVWVCEKGQDTEESVQIFSPNFFSDPGDTWVSANAMRMSQPQFLDRLRQAESCSFLEPWSLDKNAKENFFKSGEILLDQIRKGELKKGVPYSFRKSSRPPTLTERAGILRSAFQQQAKTGGALIAIWNHDSGIIALTPELLFQKEGTLVKTLALAGTRANRPGASEELLASLKDLQEHAWVVQGISESLSPLGDLKVLDRQIRESGALIHLETSIELFNCSASSELILSVLHPTPALGAFPKAKGSLWLRELNKTQPRFRYGAPVGMRVSSLALEFFFVMIRGIEWSSSRGFTQMGAGAGVVESSQLELEWEELQQKWRSIAASLGLIL